MKKKMTAWLVCLAMVLALFPAQAALAADPACEIVGGAQYDSLANAVAAVPANGTATIRLLKNVASSETLSIEEGKQITLDMNGSDLSIGFGVALHVHGGSSLMTMGSGTCHINGDTRGLWAYDGAVVNITADILAGSSNYLVNRYAIYADGATTSVTVHGNITQAYTGIGAFNGATVSITGGVGGTNAAVSASGGSHVAVTGNVTQMISASGATVNVTGSVQGTDYAIMTDNASTVAVSQNVSANSRGIWADDTGTIVTVGSVTMPVSYAVYAIRSQNHAQINVTGDISATGGTGVIANQGGQATIDGTVTAPQPIYFTDSVGALITPTTKTDYLTYSDSADPASYIWIKAVAPPAVTTDAVNSAVVTQTAAQVTGSVTSSAAVTTRGFVYGTSANPSIGGSGISQAAAGSGTGGFSAALSGLASGTVYHVRAYAANSAGTAYGEDRTFTTLAASFSGSPAAAPPSVSTASVSGVTASGATLSGAVVSIGSSPVTERGFVVGKSPNPVLGGEGVVKLQLPGGTGSFTAKADSLLPATTYYARAYAVNSAGVSYGQSIPLATGYVGDNKNAVPKTGDGASPMGIVLFAAGAFALALLRRRKDV